VDTSKREAVFGYADAVEREFGTAHFVFNNAGVRLSGTFEHLSLDEIEWQLNTNLWGVIYGTKAFLPMLLAQREGCIINMSSTLGLVGLPLQSAYSVAKFGVRGLTECLWSELEGTGGARRLRLSRRHPHQPRQGRSPLCQGRSRGSPLRRPGGKDANDYPDPVRQGHSRRGRARGSAHTSRQQGEHPGLARPLLAGPLPESARMDVALTDIYGFPIAACRLMRDPATRSPRAS
jgi:hypothetical protein